MLAAFHFQCMSSLWVAIYSWIYGCWWCWCWSWLVLNCFCSSSSKHLLCMTLILWLIKFKFVFQLQHDLHPLALLYSVIRWHSTFAVLFVLFHNRLNGLLLFDLDCFFNVSFIPFCLSLSFAWDSFVPNENIFEMKT